MLSLRVGNHLKLSKGERRQIKGEIHRSIITSRMEDLKFLLYYYLMYSMFRSMMNINLLAYKSNMS